MLAILFALISYLGWGTGDIFGTIASRKIGGYATTFWISLLGFAIASFFIPSSLESLKNLTIPTLGLLLVLTLISPFSNIALFEGLRVGNASLVGTMASSYSALSVILSLIFLGEKISFLQTIAIITIFIGTVLSSLRFKEIKKGNFISDPGVPFAAVAAIVWGIYYAFIKIPVSEIGWFWPQYFYLATFPITYLVIKLRKQKINIKDLRKNFLSLMSTCLLIFGGTFSYNFAISTGQVALIAPIAGSSSTLFVVLAFLIFKDPIKKQQIAGIITTLIGIVLLSVFSV